MVCKECYSDNPRITPLKDADDCLRRHRQYICASCGRIVCIDLSGEKRARCFMPFSSLEIAMLYLKPAEIIAQNLCGIYELIYKRGDTRFRIFRTNDELSAFLKRNRDIRCVNEQPVYISDKYLPVRKEQIRYLTEAEVTEYLQERTLYRGR